MDYPEHEKLKKVRDLLQSCGEFLEWLNENGYMICELQGHTYFPSHVSRQKLLSDFFEIDLDKLEEEKRDMIRQLNPAFSA